MFIKSLCIGLLLAASGIRASPGGAAALVSEAAPRESQQDRGAAGGEAGEPAGTHPAAQNPDRDPNPESDSDLDLDLREDLSPAEQESLLAALQLEGDVDLDEDATAQLSDSIEESLEQLSDMEIEQYPDLELEYETESGMYRYTFPNGHSLKIGVPIGGWTGREAVLELPDEIKAYFAFRDGAMLDTASISRFHENGSYQILLLDNLLGQYGNECYRMDLCFHVYDPTKPQSISYVEAPLGFRMERVLWNGREVPVQDAGYAFLSEDGAYSITFSHEGKGQKVYWTENFIVDNAAPMLLFSPPVQDGERLQQEVSFRPSEENCEVQVYLNNQEVTATERVLRQNGSYTLVVRDANGNERTYQFSLQIPLDLFKPELIAIPLLLLLIAFVVVRVARRNHRVI